MTVTDIEPAPRVLEPAQASMGCLPMWRLKKVHAFVEANLDAPLRLNDLATAAGLSRMHFAASFRATTGMRPHDYVLVRRIAFAKVMLETRQGALVQIALDAGFQSQAHFCTVFKRLNGVTPTAWRREVIAASRSHIAKTASPVSRVLQFRRNESPMRDQLAGSGAAPFDGSTLPQTACRRG